MSGNHMTWYLFLRDGCSLSDFSLSYTHWCKTFTMYFFLPVIHFEIIPIMYMQL